jgi:hypothetical protein
MTQERMLVRLLCLLEPLGAFLFSEIFRDSFDMPKDLERLLANAPPKPEVQPSSAYCFNLFQHLGRRRRTLYSMNDHHLLVIQELSIIHCTLVMVES